jgi:TatD DNase family protein
VGGSITYQRATKTRHIFSRLPLSWLVLETDAPDMPMSHQTDRLNRPDALTKVLDALTELRAEERAELAQQTTANCLQILKLARP